MAIAAIAPYPMPDPSELPAPAVAWRVDPTRAVLLVHDMQRYFLRPFDTAAAPVPELLANIARLRTAAEAAGIPVVFTAQPGDQAAEDRGLLCDFWGDGLAAGPEHEGIVDELAPGPDDVVLTKWRYSAFERSDLAERMAAQGRDQLLICGVYAHIGILTTALCAFMRDLQPFVITDAVADFSREEHLMALRHTALRCGNIPSTDVVLDQLNLVPA